jgi:hypothetical protein
MQRADDEHWQLLRRSSLLLPMCKSRFLVLRAKPADGASLLFRLALGVQRHQSPHDFGRSEVGRPAIRRGNGCIDLLVQAVNDEGASSGGTIQVIAFKLLAGGNSFAPVVDLRHS